MRILVVLRIVTVHIGVHASRRPSASRSGTSPPKGHNSIWIRSTSVIPRRPSASRTRSSALAAATPSATSEARKGAWPPSTRALETTSPPRDTIPSRISLARLSHTATRARRSSRSPRATEDLILGGLIQLYMNEPMTVVERHLPAGDLNDRFELPSRQWVHRVNGDASVPPKLAAAFCALVMINACVATTSSAPASGPDSI